MTEKDATRIGSRQGLMSIGLGLLTIQIVIMLLTATGVGFFKALFWFTTIDDRWNLLVVCILLLLCGHFYGQVASRAILIRNRNFILVGCLYGLAVLLTVIFLTGLISCIQQGIEKTGTAANLFQDYMFHPYIGVSMPGIIMAILIGIWFGTQIKAKVKKLNTKYSTQQQL